MERLDGNTEVQEDDELGKPLWKFLEIVGCMFCELYHKVPYLNREFPFLLGQGGYLL